MPEIFVTYKWHYFYQLPADVIINTKKKEKGKERKEKLHLIVAMFSLDPARMLE